jgi:hypothetical protein
MTNLHLRDRLAELPYRIRQRTRVPATTWPLDSRTAARVSIRWPRKYQWRGATPIVSAVKEGLSSLGVLRVDSFPQVHRAVVMLECEVDGQRRAVAFDYSDYPEFVNRDALDASELYIKCQFRNEGYDDPRIIPGGYPVTFTVYYKYHSQFRAKYARDRRIDVMGRFGYRFQEEIRRKAVQILSTTPDIGFVGASGKVRYSRFLREAASARLCLHLPGNGPFTHRVAEFLGLGTCMISPRFATRLHVPLEPGVHYVEVADDLSDLVDKCRHYLASHDERESVARAGQDFFDRYLQCDQMAGYHVWSILDRLGLHGVGRPEAPHTEG